MAAIEKLGVSLGFLSQRDDASTASDKFEAFGVKGERVGRELGNVFDLLVQAMTAVIQVATGIANTWDNVGIAGELVSGAVVELGRQLSALVAVLNGSAEATRESGSAWVSLGNVISFVIAVVVGAIALFVSIVSVAVSVVRGAVAAVVSVFSGLADVVTGVVFIVGGMLGGRWSDIWNGMKLVAFGVIDGVASAVLELAGAIAGVIDSIAGMFGATTNLQSGIRDWKIHARNETATDFGVQSLSFTPVKSSASSSAQTFGAPMATPMPAVAEIQASFAPGPSDQLVSRASPESAPTIVNVQIDGQTIAQAVHKAGSETSARSFSPLPAY